MAEETDYIHTVEYDITDQPKEMKSQISQKKNGAILNSGQTT